MTAQKTWRVGVAGLGTVGAGLLNFRSERPGFAPAGIPASAKYAVCASSRAWVAMLQLAALGPAAVGPVVEFVQEKIVPFTVPIFAGVCV